MEGKLPAPADERFRLLIESVVDCGLFIVDLQGLVASWNPGAERVTGYSAADITGKTYSCFYTADDIAAGRPRDHLQRAHANEQFTEDGWRVRKDGSQFRANVAISGIRDKAGNLVGFAYLVRDLGSAAGASPVRPLSAAPKAHRKRTRIRRIVGAKIEAEKENKAKDNFLAMLSHELRTPLTPALAAASYLDDNSENLPQDVREEISVIRRNIQLEARLIDDLLDFTRLIRGKVELRLEVVDAHRLLREIVEVVGDDIIEKELDVKISLNAKAHHMWADPVRIRQVFWNLVRNAAKFTPTRGQINIHSSNDEAGRFQLEVSDTGVGIEPADLGDIFAAFKQGSRSITREFGGMGLGLTISKSLIELHHGTLTVHSAGKNKGSQFTVVLAAVQENITSTDQSAPDAAAPKSLRLLLVEDHDDTRRTLSRLLSKCGHKVTSTDHVEAALKLLKTKRFDAVVSDIGLPDRSGYELIALAKQRHPIKGIALSGFGMEEDVRRSFAAGFDHHLTKPIDIRHLRDVLSEIAV